MATRDYLIGLLLALGLTACSPKTPEVLAGQVGDVVEDSATSLGEAVSDEAESLGNSISNTTSPITIAIANAVQPIVVIEPLPPILPDPAIALITRWEVTNKDFYSSRLTGLICPGGHSGPTGGIGYDFGQQTRNEILRVWGWHPDVDRLVQASGQNGVEKCNAFRNANRDIRISWDEAIRVFSNDSLPKYRRLAERALPGLDKQTPGHIGGLTSLGYRRGWSMEGERMREKRVIRSECVPASNAGCSAGQVIEMCRIWLGKPGGKGQCNRGEDEARVIQSRWDT